MKSVAVRQNNASLTCRGCLSTGVKLYDIHENRLLENYVQIIGVSLQDRLPQQLCGACATQLLRSAAFRDRCRRAYHVLVDADLKGKCITSYLEEIDIYTYSRLFRLPYVQSKTQTYEYVDSGDDKIEGLNFEQQLLIDEGHAIKTEDSDLERDNVTVAFIRDAIKENVKEKLQIKHNKKIEDLGDDKMSMAHVLDKKKIIKKKLPTTTKEKTIEYAESFKFDVKFLSEEEQLVEIEEKKKQKGKQGGTQCDYCGKNFTTQEKLDTHYSRDHDPKIGKFVCKICHSRFAYCSRLSRHLQTHRVAFRCRLCATTTRWRDKLHEHFLSHQGKKYTCQFCQKGFVKITTYFSHVRLVHASELPWCDLCGESFINDRGIKSHKSKVHKDEFAKLSCGNCCCKFSSQVALDRHTLLKKCELVSCARCGEGFSTTQLLKYHLIQRHRTDTPLLDCNTCGVVFLNVAARQRHAASCVADGGAGGGAGAACVQCGQRFRSEQLLAEHVRAAHAGETFKCEECNKNFLNAFYYRYHFERTHCGHDRKTRRSLGCGVGKSGGASSGAARGAARAWRPSGARVVPAAERPPARANAVCEVCGRGFPCVARLEAHLPTHSAERSHVCPHCAKGFRTPVALECHLRVHTGERPFRCALCPKAFKMQPGLFRHQLVHSGVRKHVCQVCQKTFQTSCSVKMHIRSVHMKMPAPRRARRRALRAPR